MINKFKKSLTIVSIAGLLFLRVAPAWALEAPTAPTPPPEPTLEQTAPTPPPEPTPPPAPTLEETINNNEETNTEDNSNTQEGGSGSESASTTSSGDSSGEQTGNQTADGQVGTTTIDTGDATNTAGVATVANTNTSSGVAGSGTGSVGVVNDGNGSDSTNTGSVGIVDNNTTSQNNSATVTNNLDQTTTTGENSASQNVGDSTITTGDANTSGTSLTAVNTNIAGLGVAEFSVVDDQVGDIVLDFAAGCIYGCGGSLTAQNTGNGSDSTNDASIDTTTNNTTVQNNDALIESNLTLGSNSGNNSANENTGGDSTIETGDANVAGNALTLANNNLSGGVYFNFVYIYGDLIGDIILPEEYFNSVPCSTCGADLLAANTANGSDSTNNASIDQTINNETFQYNDVNIENNMLLAAQTGSNSTSQNTGGDSEIKTGDTNVNGQVLNVANSNIAGGDWWLVLINEAGNWIGKILGAPSGSGTYAGSDGTLFSVDENGIITAINSGNGSGSTNNTSVSNTTNNTTVQNNTANIVNNLNLSASTGGNSASKNTGGSSSIETGDANIIASIVNMVNNNISGGGRLFVTVIDVFGSWLGNFRAPGYVPPVLAENSGSEDPQQVDVSSAGGSTEGSSEVADDSSSTSSPVPSPTSTNKLFTFVAAGSRGGGNVQVASFQMENTGGTNSDNSLTTQVNSKKVVKINLAWLLIVIPASLVAFLAIRKYRILKNK